MFTSVFSRISVIFAVLLIGAIGRWCKVLSKESTDGLTRLTFEITLPLLYFSTLAANLNRELFLSIWPLVLWAGALTLLSLAVSWIFALGLNGAGPQRRTFIFLATFGNYGFLAIPLIYALFGQEGLILIFVFNLGLAFLYWTLGVSILDTTPKKGRQLFANIFNNATIALILGLVVGITNLPLPRFLLEAARMIGDTSIALALVVIGSLLAQKDSAQKFSWRTMGLLALCRLLVIPALALVLVQLWPGLPKTWGALVVLQAAMPSASTTPILTRRFGGDSESAASGVFFTTLLSILTIPLFMSLALR
ncbi:MAG: AEC family transporter [Candidatus Omnitrophota bacterium]